MNLEDAKKKKGKVADYIWVRSNVVVSSNGESGGYGFGIVSINSVEHDDDDGGGGVTRKKTRKLVDLHTRQGGML